MSGEQLAFYAAQRAGRTAVIETVTTDIVAWIEVLPDGALRARRGDWVSASMETVPQCIRAVAAHRMNVAEPPTRAR